MNGWAIFGLLLAAYLAAWFLLRGRPGPLPGGFEFTGPLLLWRTQLGKRAIEKVARPKRFWNVVADAGIVLTWILGALIFALLLLTLYLYIVAPEQSAQNAPGPRELVGLPGVNPMIPLGYGIVALILALVIHEGSHGVMAYVSRMRVKSLGLVMFVVPVGAFVEPHEEDLMKATTREKNRVFAAGPTSNIVLAVVAGVLLSTLFVGQMAIANDGQGVVIGNIEPGSAAEMAGLQDGDLLTHLDGRAIADRASYTSMMGETQAGQSLRITFLRDGETRETTAILGDRYDYLRRVAPEMEDKPADEGGYTRADAQGKGFLGVSGVGLDGLETMRDSLAHPFSSVGAFSFYLSYPFFIFTQGIDVLSEPYSELFVVGGPMAGLPPAVFFGAATLLYWIVWLNVMLGTFNALPAGPLDGGQMFRATLSERLMRRYAVDRQRLQVEREEMGGLKLRGTDDETQAKLDRVDQRVSLATRSIGFLILGLILLPVIAPPIVRLLL